MQIGDRLYFEDRRNILRQEKQRLQDSLSFSGMHSRYESLHEAAHNTYTWILDPDPNGIHADRQNQRASFFRWFRGGGGVFWVSGKPGSGKSTLMKYLAEHVALENSELCQPDLVVLSFFFWIKGDSLQRNKSGCLRSLLWQLLQNPSTTELAVQTSQTHFKGAWTERVLRIILSAITKGTKCPMAVFLDGLDESADHDDILASLSILESANKVKLCVSSRPEPVFTDALSSYQSLRLQDLNSVDIRQVIKQSFLEDARVQALTSRITTDRQRQDFEQLSYTIEYKAEGVFLWVHLVIKDLLKGITQRDDTSTLLRRLNGLPNDISALFKDMLRRTHQDHELYKDEMALYLALALHRQFDIVEFCFAVNEDLRKRYLCPSILNTKLDSNTGADIDCETVAVQISAYTAGLLEVDPPFRRAYSADDHLYPLAEHCPPLANKLVNNLTSRIRFIHRTAIDFLQHTAEGIFRQSGSSSTDSEVKQICFETRLISEAILPGILGRCMSQNMYMRLVACNACNDEEIYHALKRQGQCTLKLLHSAGLLLPDTSTWVFSSRDNAPYDFARNGSFFPSSNYALVDSVPFLIQARRPLAAEMLLDDYDCMSDTDYLTKVLLVWVRTYRGQLVSRREDLLPTVMPARTILKYGKRLLERLVNSCASLRQRLVTELGEVIDPISAIVWSTKDEFDDNFVQMLRLLQFSDAYLDVRSMPDCFNCHRGWHSRRARDDLDIEFWGAFCPANNCDTSMLGRKGDVLRVDPQILRSEDDRVQVIASFYARSAGVTVPPRLSAISKKDSSLLISKARRYSNDYSIGNQAPGIILCSSESLNPANHAEVSSNTIESICARSPTLTFAAAMERLGKSQGTIRKFYVSEAERMAHELPGMQKGWKEWYWGTEIPPEVDTVFEDYCAQEAARRLGLTRSGSG